jgi:hypothetical protein
MKNTRTISESFATAKLRVKRRTLLTIALAAVMGLVMMACQTEDDGPKTATYSGFDADGVEYVLTITDGNSFELKVGSGSNAKTSKGKASGSGSNWTLTPTGAAESFTVTVSSSGISAMAGTITFTDGTTADAPSEIGPANPNPPSGNDPFAGTWEVQFDDPPPDAFRIEAADGSYRQYTIINGTQRDVIRGTYSVSGNTANVTMIAIDKNGFGGPTDAAWVEWADLSSKDKTFLGGSQTYQITISGNQFEVNGMTFIKQ